MLKKYSSKLGFAMTELLVALVVFGLIAPPLTQYMSSVQEGLADTKKMFEASTVLSAEWERLEKMTYNEIESSKNTLKDYSVDGYNIQFSFHGNGGTFQNGSCGSALSSETIYKDCHNVSVKVSKDNQELVSTGVIPLTERPLSMDEVKTYLHHYVHNAAAAKGTVSLAVERDADTGSKNLSFLFNGSAVPLHGDIELLGVPDWSKKRKQSVPFTATETGYFFLMNDVPIKCVNSRSPNGTTHAHILCTYHTGSYFFPVSKGDYMYWCDSIYASNNAYFVPAKKQGVH